MKYRYKRVPLFSILLLIAGLVFIFYYEYLVNNNKEVQRTGQDLYDDFIEDTTEDELSDTEEEVLKVKFNLVKRLREEYNNEDIIGYIDYSDAKISYPILQGQDSFEYLKKNPYGKSSSSGSIYLDAFNSKDFSDVGNVIYGHNMIDGSMFGDLEKHIDEVGIECNEKLFIYTEEERIQYRVYAYIIISPINEDIKELAYKGEVKEYKEILSRNIRDKSDELLKGEKFINLITCHYERGTTIRYSLVAEEIGREKIVVEE